MYYCDPRMSPDPIAIKLEPQKMCRGCIKQKCMFCGISFIKGFISKVVSIESFILTKHK